CTRGELEQPDWFDVW
nr:immunoglobulin heavy chain junction region [Macaca mulatta]MOW81076.1 immunoglobulin heavy chain junction region [Macaca mulatta]